MTCRDLIGLAADVLASDLTARSRSALRRHVQDCEPCRRYLHSYATTIVLVKDAFAIDDAHDNLPEEMVSRILSARLTV